MATTLNRSHGHPHPSIVHKNNVATLKQKCLPLFASLRREPRGNELAEEQCAKWPKNKDEEEKVAERNRNRQKTV